MIFIKAPKRAGRPWWDEKLSALVQERSKARQEQDWEILKTKTKHFRKLFYKKRKDWQESYAETIGRHSS